MRLPSSLSYEVPVGALLDDAPTASGLNGLLDNRSAVNRSGFGWLLLLALVALGVSGCDWTLLLAFKGQMRAVQEYTAWEGPEKEVFVFKQPLLSRIDVEQLGIFLEVRDDRSAVLRYRRVDCPPGADADLEIWLLFTDGKLSGINFPASLRDGLGRENVRGFFGLMGGGGKPGGIGSIPKHQLLSAKLFPPSAEPMAREVHLLWMPWDPRNRPIEIKLKERDQKPGYFSDLSLSFRKRPGAGM